MIENIISDIQSCLDNHCYYAALALSLTLPDICGAQEYPEASVANRYINWYNAYIGGYEESQRIQAPDGYKVSYLSGEVIYNLRNTFLHQGSANINSQKMKDTDNPMDELHLIITGDEIVITEMDFNCQCAPIGMHFSMHLVDVRYLCSMLAGVAEYYNRTHQDNAPKNNSLIIDFRKNDPEQRIIHSAKFDKYENILTQVMPDCAATFLEQFKKDRPKIDELLKSGDDFQITQGNIQPIPAKKDASCQKISNPKEHRIRSIYGKKFKDGIYKEKKEAIISALTNAATQKQLRRALYQVLPQSNADKIIAHFLEYLDLPKK